MLVTPGLTTTPKVKRGFGNKAIPIAATPEDVVEDSLRGLGHVEHTHGNWIHFAYYTAIHNLGFLGDFFRS